MKFDLGSIIGIVGIIVGAIIAIFFYFKGQKRKKLAYNLETNILISESLSNYENLEILYNNETIKSLKCTNIKIRNIGNDIIEPENLIPSTPITIKTSNDFLLQDVTKYEIKCSNPKNRVFLELIDKSHIKVLFDFLNPKDEIQITVLHTGTISITGELKQGDVKQYSNKKYEKEDDDAFDLYYGRYRKFRMLIFPSMILSLVFLLTISMLMMFLDGSNSSENSSFFMCFIALSPIFIAFMMFFLIFNSNDKL